MHDRTHTNAKSKIAFYECGGIYSVSTLTALNESLQDTLGQCKQYFSIYELFSVSLPFLCRLEESQSSLMAGDAKS